MSWRAGECRQPGRSAKVENLVGELSAPLMNPCWEGCAHTAMGLEMQQLVADLMRALGHLTEKLERVRLTKEEEEGKRRATIAPGAGTDAFDEEPVASI